MRVAQVSAISVTLLVLTCVTLIAVRGRAGASGRVDLKQMTMAETIAAAKKIQIAHAVTSAYAPKPRIQQKHKAHRAAAPAESYATSDADAVADMQTGAGSNVPVPADYARGLIVPAAGAQAQMYNNDQNVKVVTGIEGDDVASGIGGGVGGQVVRSHIHSWSMNALACACACACVCLCASAREGECV